MKKQKKITKPREYVQVYDYRNPVLPKSLSKIWDLACHKISFLVYVLMLEVLQIFHQIVRVSNNNPKIGGHGLTFFKVNKKQRLQEGRSLKHFATKNLILRAIYAISITYRVLAIHPVY